MVKGLISFIILTYKNFDGIYETLDSLFAQDYPQIELIVSDDGSPNVKDKMPDIENYINHHKKDNIVNVIINCIPENVGTVQNVNQALKLANGEYIKSLGAEDVLNATDALSRYRTFLDTSGLLICFSRLRGVTPEGAYKFKLASCEDDYNFLRSLTPEGLMNYLFKRNCLPAPALFVKKELYETYGYYPTDTRLVEDYPYWLYLCSKNVKIGFIDDRLIDYKLTGVSSAGHYSVMFMKDMFVIYEKYIFPYDRRFGIFQKIYNQLKRDGLNTYVALAEWDGYSFGKKVRTVIRFGPFLLYIKLQSIAA